MTRLLAFLCLLIFAALPAEAGLFHRKKQPPRAVYGMSKEKQRKEARKYAARAHKQRSKAIKKAPTVRGKQSES